MSELISLEQKDITEVFTVSGIEPIIDQVRKRVSEFEPDMTTKKGREEIASMAYKVAKSKTYLDDLGKKLTEDWKSRAKVVDECRRKVRDVLDALKDEVRRPLTEWEDAEKERIANFKAQIDNISALGAAQYEVSADAREALFKLEAISTGKEWQEFESVAVRAKEESTEKLSAIISKLEKAEAEKAELERLRKEAAEREQAERERRIAEDAARKAKEEAERIAREEAEKAEKARLAEIARQESEKQKIEQQKADAERRAQEEKARAERAEKEKAAAALKAEQDRIEAEKRAKAREEELKRKAEEDKQKAIEAERQRVQAEKEKLEAEEKKRQANIKHRKEVNNSALEAIIKASGISEEQGKAIIAAIAKGEVPNVAIKY